MMNSDILNKIDSLINECDEELIRDTSRFISIKSERGAPVPGAPFGEGPRKMLDEVLRLGNDEGFHTADYGVGVVSLAFSEGEPSLGIWLHGDVVTTGEGWSFPPYEATLYNGCIIGRGACDNKGQLAAVFNLFKIFKRLGIKLTYNAAIYVGSSEESGMQDMKGLPENPDAKGFINVCTPPRLSLVPDGSFPIGYGARGLASFYLRSKTKLGFTLTAGEAGAPGLAVAKINGRELPSELIGCEVLRGECTEVRAFCPPVHSAHSGGAENVITRICSALSTLECFNSSERRILEALRDISLDTDGRMLGINTDSALMTPTLVYAQSVTSRDFYPEIQLRVRYPIETSFDEISEKLSEYGARHGYDVRGERSHEPYIRDKESAVIVALREVANEVTGTDREPYVNGATYAHYLPNSYIFGMDGCCPPEDFPKGRGGAHGVDECVSVERLKRAMKIYARALLRLDEIEW